MDTDMDYPSFDLQSTHISFDVEFNEFHKNFTKIFIIYLGTTLVNKTTAFI